MLHLIDKFYTAFSILDGKTMSQCYHPDALFNDEVFVNLSGKEAGLMWKMLIERSKGNLNVRFTNIKIEGDKGSAEWVAEYIFSATNRKIVNSIHAKFEFKDGLIYRHTDRFNFHRWATQAFGFKGWFIGGFVFFRKKVQEKARLGLDKYIQKHQ